MLVIVVTGRVVMIDVIVDGIVVVCFNIIVVNLVKRDLTVEVIVVVDLIVVTALFKGINEADTSPKAGTNSRRIDIGRRNNRDHNSQKAL